MNLQRLEIAKTYYMATTFVSGCGVRLPVAACSHDRREAMRECFERAKKAKRGLM